MINKSLEELLDFKRPFEYDAISKKEFFIEFLSELNNHHLKNSVEYENIISNTNLNKTFKDLYEMPYIPVRLFKMLELKSIENKDIFKTLTSSGTSGQAVSQIFLDKDNTSIQSKVLNSIMHSFLGRKRRKMCIVDEEDILKNKKKFSARAAGVLGFSMYGRNHVYSNDSNLNLNLNELKNLEKQYKDAGVLFFGFTSIVWMNFFQLALKNNLKLDFGNDSVLIHGGGWKKLEDHKVTNDIFKNSLQTQFGIERIYNYYGMIEQTGSIFMECEEGHFHPSIFSDVIVRDEITHKVLPHGREGLIQVISLLPKSYPGFSLLTEDIGTIFGEDDCACGRKGKYFKVRGRMKASEVRGCSDTR